MPLPEAQFLHQRDPNLHNSAEVTAVVDYLRQSGESIPNQPDAKLAAHLGFLAHQEYANDGVLTGNQPSIDRQIDARVIDAEDVPDAYFELQQRIAHEQGHGDIAITKAMREQLVEVVQADQQASLSNWVEYLGAEAYPDWFKQYTFNAVVKMGVYDKEKGKFGERSVGTTAAYAELNREALAYVFDKLNKHRIQGEPLEPHADRLKKLLDGANFSKLYVHALKEVSPPSEHLKQDIRGVWTKFDQTSDPRRARLLSGSLQGHGTGWCTAGESTAETHLAGGDFYVYYTRDEEGKETIPRVAIRMENHKVAEVRGINAQQELESELADVASEQLADLPGGEEYIVVAEDMKRLTKLEKLLVSDWNADLSKDDVRFLYEIGHTIKNFGYSTDPRIDDLQTLRGEVDHPVLRELAVEHIRESFEEGYAAYATVAERLGAMRPTTEHVRSMDKAALEQLFDTKMQQWEQDGVLAYVADALVERGELHTPVITPEVEVISDEIMALAVDFGLQQSYQTFVETELHEIYTGAELSGPSGVHISLVPSKYDALLSRENQAGQQRMLTDRQIAHPALRLHVPSVLDAITYWHTLRAAGDTLDDGSTYDKTAIRHFDMDPKRVGGSLCVPRSVVSSGGQPSLNLSSPDDVSYSRLALG